MSQRGASFRHNHVSSTLRALRKERGLSCKEVASALGFSEAKVSRMETGDRGLDADDVAAVLGFLRAPLQPRQELMALVRSGHTKNWQEIHGQLPSNWKEIIYFERRAEAVFNYQPLLIPGLAQTPEYARITLRGVTDGLTADQIETLVASRMGRQVVIGRIKIHLLIDEMALRRRLDDPAMMADQLRHLRALAKRRNVIVQAVPHDAPAHPGLDGALLILDFGDEGTLIQVEGRNTNTFLEESVHVRGAKTAWSKIHSVALSPDESLHLITSIESELA
ncbi:helix-turn-helix domain-containing protein [Lentzea sp. E54]|uniref:helix-turn-helix domain-containing protein n=1 Tax=Lentzea xerophila TaxID=3435883 RepID=UPI003DA68B67